MFEKEIKFIVDFNLNKMKKLGSFFTFEKMVRAEIHPSILKYISSEIDLLIYEDRKKLINNSAFDYTGSEIANYFNLISDEIKKTKRLNYEDVKKLLVQAVSFISNFLIRPKWSLSKLIYDNNQQNASKSVEEIRFYLRFAYYYEHINTIFNAYLNKKQITHLTKEEFEEIFEKIDKELFISQPQKMIDNALYSMADFFNIGAVAKTKISISHIESFLKGKNLSDYLFRLKQSLPHDIKSKYEIDSIRTALYFPIQNINVEEVQIESKEEIEIEDNIEAFENEELNINISEEEVEISSEETESLPIREIVSLKSVIAEIENEKPEFSREKTKVEPEITKEVIEEKTKEEIISDNEILLTEFERELLDDIDEALSISSSNYSSEENINKEIKSIADEEKIIDQNNELNNVTTESLSVIIEEETSDNQTEDLEELIINNIKTITAEDLFSSVEKNDNDELNINDVEELESEQNYETDLDEQLELEIKDKKIELTVDDLFEEPEPEIEDEIETNEVEFEKEIEIEEETEEAEEEINDETEDEEEVTQEEKINIKRDKDIFDYISDKEAAKITAVIFLEDSEDFATTLEKISDCSNYDEATEILKAVFNSYKINYYNREAVLLTNIVASYFGQE